MTICLSPGAATAGGLLLGATAGVMIQALELLLRDKPSMEQLEKYIADGYYFALKTGVDDIKYLFLQDCLVFFPQLCH